MFNLNVVLLRSLNNSLNHIHHALCLLHDDYCSSFSNILETSNEKTMHQKDLEPKISPKIYVDLLTGYHRQWGTVFLNQNSLQCQNFQSLYSDNKKVKLGTETITNWGSQICNLIPGSTWNASSFNTCKN